MVHDLKSREISFLAIKRILDNDNTVEEAMAKFSTHISPEDRGFMRFLLATTVRRLGQLDKIINHCTQTKLGNTQMPVRHVLRLGITQLLFMDVPAYAAVNTSVSLVQVKVPKKLHYLKNTVNAVLRKIDREREMLLKKFGNTRLNFPKWLLQSWDARYGQAVVKNILDALLQEAPLDISLKPGLDLEHWIDKLGGREIEGGAIRVVKSGKIPDIYGYDEGHWWIQDAAARIPAQLLGAKSEERVLDLCAAPGGKAAQSASMGASVTAVDLSDSRLAILRQNMARLKLNVDVMTSDILSYKPEKNFDFILLDAPCSSSGTIRRHPEILHSRSPDDVKKLAILQSKMLDHAVTLLNKGGTLVYCVCSMEKEEGPDQIKALLERQGSLKRKEILAKELPDLEQVILESGDVQTLPHHIDGGMDGFFISRIVKN